MLKKPFILDPQLFEIIPVVFTKITEIMAQGTKLYIPVDEAKYILEAGLKAEDSTIRENVEHARENLLRLRHFHYLEVE